MRDLKSRTDSPSSCEVIEQYSSFYDHEYSWWSWGAKSKQVTFTLYKSSQSNWYWLNFRCNELLVRIQRILFPLQKAAWHSTMQDVLFGPHDAEIRKMSRESWWMFYPHCDWRFRRSKWFQMARHLGKHVNIEHPWLFNALNVAKWLGTGECSTQQRCTQCFWDRTLIQLSCRTQGGWVINPE